MKPVSVQLTSGAFFFCPLQGAVQKLGGLSLLIHDDLSCSYPTSRCQYLSPTSGHQNFLPPQMQYYSTEIANQPGRQTPTRHRNYPAWPLAWRMALSRWEV